ncbi:MAG: AmmeMemoRadiSam system protein A [Desulfovibrionaceae bacterium]
MGYSFSLDAKEKATLLKLARWAVDSGLGGVDVSKRLLEDLRQERLCVPRGCFVTLRLNNILRGCMGTVLPVEPLYKNVIYMAYAAAFSDPHFTPLTTVEWPKIRCEISIVGPLSRCPEVGLIEVGRHGLILQKNKHSSMFLPSVPVEAGWDLVEYLDNLCLKANLLRGAWREADVQLCWFESYTFSDG